MPKFELTADYSPTGDQPEAIANSQKESCRAYRPKRCWA